MKPRSGRYLTAGALVVLLGACGASGKSTAPAPSGTVSRAPDVPPALAGTGVLPEPSSAWPAAGYDARHSSATAAVGPSTGRVRWKRDLGGNLTPGPVIGSDGSVLAATNGGVLVALDPATGVPRWRFDAGSPYGSDLSTSPAVVAGGTVLWPGPANTLYALDLDGHLLWKESFAGVVLSPAVAGGNRVYVADMSAHLTALEVVGARHSVVWSIGVGTEVDYASPTVGPDGTVYTASGNDLVAVRDTGPRGAVLWVFRSTAMVEVSTAVDADGTVVVGTNGDRQYGLGPDGGVRWAVDIGDYTYSSATATPLGRSYFGDNTGRVRVVDTRTGTVELTLAPLGDGKEKVWTSVAVDARGSFYWATTERNVYGYRADGTQLFKVATGSSTDGYPAIGAGGTLFVGTTGGTLYAIR